MCHQLSYETSTLTLILKENNSVPEWVNTGLQECLRFRDIFDDNVLQMQGVSVDKERFYILYRGYKRSLKDYLNDQSNVSNERFQTH